MFDTSVMLLCNFQLLPGMEEF